MMGLLDEIQTHNQPVSRGCVVRDTLDALSKEERAELEAALQDATITHKAIAVALINRGHKMHPAGKQVAKHRRGECACRA
jgi:uncharacterized membrane protein YgcG